jgi:hypothetical protein
VEFPKLQSAGDWFLYYNKALTSVEIPKLQSAGDGFLNYNENRTAILKTINKIK